MTIKEMKEMARKTLQEHMDREPVTVMITSLFDDGTSRNNITSINGGVGNLLVMKYINDETVAKIAQRELHPIPLVQGKVNKDAN